MLNYDYERNITKLAQQKLESSTVSVTVSSGDEDYNQHFNTICIISGAIPWQLILRTYIFLLFQSFLV